MSEWHSTQNTYGWVRAEVLGAFVNAVFLSALCFTILIEALKRLATESTITDPDLMFIVGGVGLFVNIIGLFLFSGIGSCPIMDRCRASVRLSYVTWTVNMGRPFWSMDALECSGRYSQKAIYPTKLRPLLQWFGPIVYL